MKLKLADAEKIADRVCFRFGGLIVAVAQDAHTSEVLMVAFMNREALIKTLTTGLVHYWSVSRGRLWMKGEMSGNIQRVVDVIFDCDYDTVLVKVEQVGVACHEGFKSCFHNKIDTSSVQT
ncbi:MAG: phosphoribosyl-AMP cyclohydrolase [Candidatus Bathyarchaeia archaeon]